MGSRTSKPCPECQTCPEAQPGQPAQSCPECPACEAQTCSPLLTVPPSKGDTCQAYLIRLLVPILNDAISNAKDQPLPQLIASCPLSTLDHLQLCELGKVDVELTEGCFIHVNLHELEGLGQMKITNFTYFLTHDDVFDIQVDISLGILHGKMSTEMDEHCSYAMLAAGYFANCNHADVTIGTATQPNLVHLELLLPLGCSDTGNITLQDVQVSLSSISFVGCGILTAIRWIPQLPELIATNVSSMFSNIVKREMNQLLAWTMTIGRGYAPNTASTAIAEVPINPVYL